MTTPSFETHLHNPRILVIDDEPRIRDACIMVLSDKGFDVAAAPDGEQEQSYEGLIASTLEHGQIKRSDLAHPQGVLAVILQLISRFGVHEDVKPRPVQRQPRYERAK